MKLCVLIRVVSSIVAANCVLGTLCAQPVVIYVGTSPVDRLVSGQTKLEDALLNLGLAAGREYRIVRRSYNNDKTQLPALARAVVQEAPAVIYASGMDAALEFSKHTSVIPIIFQSHGDLASKNFSLVKDLQRPEANVTGFSHYSNVVGQRFQLLRDAFPNIRTLGFVFGDAFSEERQGQYLEAARKLGLTLNFRRVKSEDLPTLATRLDEWDDGYVFALDNFLTDRRDVLPNLAARSRKPMIFPEKATDKGVLMHYSSSALDGPIKAAEYISKILRGAKIKDLAVQEPQEFDLSVNVTTLKRNGLTMSRDVLSRARKVE